MSQHIAIYARVSTKRQDTKSQEPDLKRWLAAYAASQPVRWYRDKATGTNMDRPGWQRLESAIDAGDISTLLVWRIDRLGRTASGLTALFEKLTTRKVNLVSIKDGIDLSTPAGRLLANMLASVAMFETEVRSERILAGQEVAKKKGKTWGGSQKGRLLSITAEQVETVRKMNADGVQKATIARSVGVDRSSVYRLLRDAK